MSVGQGFSQSCTPRISVKARAHVCGAERECLNPRLGTCANRHFWKGSVHLCMLDGNTCSPAKIIRRNLGGKEHHEQRLEVGPHSGGWRAEQSN